MTRTAVIFDLDGTLVDSLEDLADSMNAVLTRAGLPGHPLAAYRYFVGEGIEALVLRALPADRRDEAAHAGFVAAMREEYGRRYLDKTRPYPGVPELLDGLTARGVPLAVLSNKPHGPTVEMVAKLLGRWPFRAVAGARPGVPKKPDPTAAVAIAAELGVAPGSVVYVGDTATDMRTAGAAGMFGVGVLWGFRTADELREAGARALVGKPGEILGLLQPG
ncbi:MAG: HAD family hydrolase [Deferrisomatales bacterium]